MDQDSAWKEVLENLFEEFLGFFFPQIQGGEMSVITTAERLGRQKGIEQGMEKGLEKGLEKGIEKILQIKFGDRGRALYARVKRVQDLALLEALMDELSEAQNVAEAEAIIENLASKQKK